MTTISAQPDLAEIAAAMSLVTTGRNMNESQLRALAQVSLASGVSYGMASFIGRSCEVLAANVGFNGSQTYGFSFLNYGVISGAFRGNSVFNMDNTVSIGRFQFVIDGVFASNYFKYAIVRNAANLSGVPLAILDTAATSSFSQAGGRTAWLWDGIGLNWSSFVGQDVFVQFCY